MGMKGGREGEMGMNGGREEGETGGERWREEGREWQG